MSNDRLKKIKELLEKNGKVYVNDLSKRFSISKVSIRKYLTKLEHEEIATRFYGGASLAKKSRSDEQNHNLYENELWNTLATKARELIMPGDSIFIGSGRACCVLANKLDGIENLTVVTNNITALPDLIKNSKRVYLIGGEVTSTDSQTLFSSWESPRPLHENIYVKKAFTSTSGIDRKAGLTVDSIISTYIFKLIPSITNRWYLMADASKFDKIAIYSVAEIAQISAIITDRLPDDYLPLAKELNIEII